ncbi:uncharacterized protein LOC119070043 [Bradysia coprophila]|uniref:uncharacterized protein LOC119070043 n=1 Tax=Bradysia coprophila TaxID=38358 RepID=UPI00187D6FCA|nr:uncharacterized protein LOC119070043 [Bradysia coprophila]
MASRDEQSDLFLNSDAVGDDFFYDIIEKKLDINRDKFTIRLVLLSPATGKNENFVSVVYRAKIKIEMLETKLRRSVDVIVKVLLSTMEELKAFSVFPRERFMYEDVLSSYERIWLDRAGEKIRFGPRSIKFETDPYEIIVLDDLKAEKYEMLKRQAGLNLVQAKLLLEKLAKFHAASAIRYQTDGILQNYFDRKSTMPEFPEDSPFIQGFKRMHQGFADSVKNYGDCDEAAAKIASWDFKKLHNVWVDAAVPMGCGFQVMNHGDIWLNNMMFRSDEDGNSVDVKLIDFQIAFWASPVLDLLYFLVSSVADDIKIDHFDDLIEFYHEQLTSALKRVKFDQHIPTLSEINVDLLEKGGFACVCLMFILFVVKNDSSEEIDMETMMSGDADTLHRFYNGDGYKKAAKLWLHFLNKRGFLDTLIVEEKQEGL